MFLSWNRPYVVYWFARGHYRVLSLLRLIGAISIHQRAVPITPCIGDLCDLSLGFSTGVMYRGIALIRLRDQSPVVYLFARGRHRMRA